MYISHRRILLNPVTISLCIFLSPVVNADEYYFPRALISDADNVADMSILDKGNGQIPGLYQVDILLNESQVASSKSVRFVPSKESSSNSTGLQSCMSREWYEQHGVQLDKKINDIENTCFILSDVIPEATEFFDFPTMRLHINVPQASMKISARDDVPPDRWDEGIDALLLNYRFNGDNSKRGSLHTSSQYINFEPGLNIGAWRLRDNSIYTHYSERESRHEWNHIKTYAQRTVVPWRSELTVGESATTGDIFDSMDFRGVQLSSDDDMYPDSMKGYAPVIRGIALSNARVTIRQSGYVIYQTYVSPGPFEIRDLYSMASSGDLTVLVTESDGKVRQFTMPYSAVPILQRPGHQRYSLTAGTFRSGDESRKPGFAEGTYIRGFENNVTAYGGGQVAENYRAMSIGAGMNMGKWGAISADITQANSRLVDGSKHQGQSLRFLYAHSFNTMGTTFQLTGYRYSTKGFYTLEESARKHMSGREGPEPDLYNQSFKEDNRPYYNLNNSRRQRFVANISQVIGSYGSIYLTGTHQSYWNTDSSSTSWQAGFNSSLRGVSYNVSWGYTREPRVSGSDQTVALSLSMPLDIFLSGRRDSSTYLTSSYSHSSKHVSQTQAGLSGTALEANNLNWSVAAGRSKYEGDKTDNGTLNLYYQGGYGNVSTGYNYSKDDRQLNYGLAGGVVIHRNGLTLSQPLGETNILVAAPGAANVSVDNQTGVHTDWRGYTVVPYASVYRENTVSLNTLTLGNHTELDSSAKEVVPTRGALVRADFRTRTGYRAMMTLMRKGKPLPFGSIVTYGDNASIIGDDGQVYLSGLSEKGSLKVSWGDNDNEQCIVNYLLPNSQLDKPLIVLTMQCK